MKNKKIKTQIICLSLCALLAGGTICWLHGGNGIDVSNLDGGLYTSYFYSGDGSEEDPFTITRPVHFYNMSSLMRYEPETYCNAYYRVGYPLNQKNDPDDDSLYVYDYSDVDGSHTNISKVLDMRSFPIFPVGNEDCPFEGVFDGSGLTVSKVYVSSEGECDTGIFGYVGEEASIKNCYFNEVEVNVDDMVLDTGSSSATHTSHEGTAYVGYIAGHVEKATSFENVYVNNCSINGTNNISNLQNNWGYFGYCYDAKSLEEFVTRAGGGGEIAWGGSVDMKSMYERVESIESEATVASRCMTKTRQFYEDTGELFNTVNTNSPYTKYYKTRKEGSFVFLPFDQNNQSAWTTNFNYLGGGTLYTDEQYVVEMIPTKIIDGYYIRSGTTYLGTDGTNLTTDQTLWTFSNKGGTGTVYTTIDDTNYYLYCTRGGSFFNRKYTLSISTDTFSWSNSTTNKLKTNSWTAYITYDNGWKMTTNSSSANTTIDEESRTETLPTNVKTDSVTYMNYADAEYNTYFPLITNEDSREVAMKNTGYVIAGSDYRTSSFPTKSGDIRVSKYPTYQTDRGYGIDIHDISSSYNHNTHTLTNVYNVNDSGRTETIDINNNDYKKFSESKTDFLESIQDGNIYGLHFIQAPLDTDHIVTADYAMINGQEYENYEMPANSIDCSITEKGYINFFAGTYFSNNDSFFSLKQIFRDRSNKITAIKEIEEIFGDDNIRHDYIYKYSDGTYSKELTSDYSSVFKLSRIMQTNNIIDNAVYYFEIPVNKGEFALGSVEGSDGAYLMYLDIQTNGGESEGKVESTFGSVEYRDSPSTVDNSICLLTYVHPMNAGISVIVTFEPNENPGEGEKLGTYYVEVSCTTQITLKVTLLDKDYIIYVNNENNFVDTISTKSFTF